MKRMFLLLFLIGLTFGREINPRIYKTDEAILKTIDLTQPLVLDEAVPDKVAKHVHFYLFTHRNPSVQFELTLDNLKESTFLAKNPTKLVTHGWTEHGEKGWIINIKNQYLMEKDYNVIAIDWSHYARMEYTISAGKTKSVGSYVGQLIVKLMEEFGSDAKDFHCAGHSLGSHVCGFAGKQVILSTTERMGRITGLDPAGPLFQFPIMQSELNRLSSNDANFVDIIHSSGGTLGFSVSIGHVDFYPNGGIAIQKGCGLDVGNICSHCRSYDFYAESILNNQFLGIACDSWKDFKKNKCKNNEVQQMGFHASLTARGNFFLSTNKKELYALGSTKYTI